MTAAEARFGEATVELRPLETFVRLGVPPSADNAKPIGFLSEDDARNLGYALLSAADTLQRRRNGNPPLSSGG